MAGGLIGTRELVLFTVGVVVAGLAVLVRARADVANGRPPRVAARHAAVRLGLLASALAIAVVTLLPQPWSLPGGVNLVPFASTRQLATNSVAASVAVRNVAGNVLLFVPFGFFAAAWWRGRRPWAVAVGAAAALSVAVEVGQAVFPSGRSVDVDDVILNVCGAAIGAGVLVVLRHVARRRSVAAHRRPSTPVR